MNVAMIGFSRSGKTSYMAAMYDWFSKNSVEGFSIEAKSDSAGRALLALADRIRGGIYPPGTAIQDKYEFRLKFKGVDLADFEWLDYRGGLLDAILEGADQDYTALDDYESLAKFIAKASALIVFLDSTDFIGPPSAAIEAQLRVVNALVQQVAATRSNGVPLPVSFVLTKIDRSMKTSGDRAKILNTRAGRTLKRVLDDMAGSDTLSAMLTGTAVGPDCQNIAYPLLMSMCSALREERARVAKEYKTAAEEHDRFAGKAGVWDDICSFFKEEITYRELAQDRLESANELADRHNRIIPALDKIDEILQTATRDGQKFVYVF